MVISKTKENYEEFEDEITSKVCSGCLEIFEDLEGHEDECPTCGDELCNSTILENEQCTECKKTFQMWDEYTYKHEEVDQYICESCFEKLPNEKEKEKSTPTILQPRRMVNSSELKGKVIRSVRQAKWAGATVIETTDNCICVLHSDYDYRTRSRTFDELTDLEAYDRLIGDKW